MSIGSEIEKASYGTALDPRNQFNPDNLALSKEPSSRRLVAHREEDPNDDDSHYDNWRNGGDRRDLTELFS